MFRRKQICKVTNNYSDKPIYGISLGNGLFLLETGKVGKTNEYESKHLYTSIYSDNSFTRIEANATRNVPEDIRILLEEGLVNLEKILKIRDNINKEMQEINKFEDKLKVLPTKIINAKGEMTPNEFKEEFLKNLSIDLSYQIKESYTRDFYGEVYWDVECSNKRLSISRDYCIDKYIGERYSFTYREYDGCLMISEEDEQYRKILKQIRKELNCNMKIDDFLSIGDKETLNYTGYYEIPLKKTLTKEYAKELANEFSKTRNINKER